MISRGVHEAEDESTEGNLYQVTDHTNGKIYTFSYDLLGRLVHVSDEKGTDYQYISAMSFSQLICLRRVRCAGGTRFAPTEVERRGRGAQKNMSRVNM